MSTSLTDYNKEHKEHKEQIEKLKKRDYSKSNTPPFNH